MRRFQRPVALVLCAAFTLLVGCATTPKRTPPAAATTAAARPSTPQPPGPTLPVPEVKPAPKPAPPPAPKPVPLPEEGEPVPAGMIRVRIESRPAGALIVVGDKVVGHAPLAITLPVTLRGFFAEAVTIRARFLAQDAQQESVSVKELCEPVDRVPKTIMFTPTGATRVAF